MNPPLLELARLIDVLNTHARGQKRYFFDPDLLGTKPTKSDSEGMLYLQMCQAITERNLGSEDELAEKLFGTNASDPKYRQLKAKLKSRLLNALVFVDTKTTNFSQVAQEGYRLERRVLQCELLNVFAPSEFSYDQWLSLLRDARVIERTSVEITCLHFLARAVSSMGRSKENALYVEELETALKWQRDELRAATLLDQVTIKSALLQSTQRATKDMIGEYVEEAKMLYARSPRFDIGHALVRLQALYHQINGQFRKAIDACDDAVNFLAKYPLHSSSSRRAEFQLKKLTCALHIHDFESGEAAAAECELYFPRGSGVWQSFKEIHILLLMHKGDFDKSDEMIEDFMGHVAFNSLTSLRKERWQLLKYFVLFARGEKVNNLYAVAKDIDVLQAQMPENSKDKEGYNFSIIALNLLALLAKQDIAGFHERIAAVKKYAYRYLRAPENKQHRIFADLMVLLDQSLTDDRNIKADVKNLLKELHDAERDPVSAEAMPPLPYGFVWEKVMEIGRASCRERV